MSYVKIIRSIVIFSATVYKEVVILFSLTCWMETMLYSHMFYAIFQFGHRFNSNLWMETKLQQCMK